MWGIDRRIMPAPGKTLEADIRDALNAIGAWHHNFENTGVTRHKDKALRPADKIACIDGPALLIECKENASQNRLDFDELRPHQQTNLYCLAGRRGEAVIATSFKERRRWRTFLIWYTDWAHLKRTTKAASLSLVDGQRSDRFVELKKVEVPHIGRVWDLESGVRELRALGAAPLYHLSPQQERRGF